MFAWTVGNVLAALDAGIAEVISVYNSAHAWSLRQNAHRRPGQTFCTPAHAHDFALTSTMTWLDGIEKQVARENFAVEELLRHITLDTESMVTRYAAA